MAVGEAAGDVDSLELRGLRARRVTAGADGSQPVGVSYAGAGVVKAP